MNPLLQDKSDLPVKIFICTKPLFKSKDEPKNILLKFQQIYTDNDDNGMKVIKLSRLVSLLRGRIILVLPF
jgi:hypothetical protein